MKHYRWMVALWIAVAGTWSMIQPAGAQSTSSVPQVQAVYGGTVGSMAAVPVPGETNKSRLFISTDSPNSVYYTDVNHSIVDPLATNHCLLQVVPDMDANANHGEPWWVAAHPPSSRLFVACDDGLFSCTIASNSITTNIPGQMAFVLIHSNVLFAIQGDVPEVPKLLYYGMLDTDGTLTLGASLSTQFNGTVKAATHPVNRKLYVLENVQTHCALYKSSSDCDAFSAATTFTPVSVPTGANCVASQIGIGPDGRLFLGGAQVMFSSDDGATWTTSDTPLGGGVNIVCNGSSNAYEVYYGCSASSNKGEIGTWSEFPRGGQRIPPFSHANSGCVEVDPLNTQIIYLTTDKGMGASTNLGVDCFELNQGLTAVQINDFSMSASKDIAWLASKAGVRRATHFNTTPVWTDSEFPNAIVQSIAMDPADASSLTAYAGSGLHVYKTTTGGGTNDSDWISVLDVQAGEMGVTNGMSDGECKAMALDGNAVYAGFYGYATTQCEGRIDRSPDNGTTWSNIMTGIDVNDIIVNDESGTHAIYMAVSLADPPEMGGTDDGGIYRFVAGSGMVRDLTNSVDIRDLAVDSSGNIYASGTISGSGGFDVQVYYKALGSATWTTLTTNGLPTGVSESEIIGRDVGPVMTVGQDSSSNDIPILAAVRTLYYLPSGGTNWVSLYHYPNGTQVKMLYWDELLVGTTIGLFNQTIQTTPTAVNTIISADFDGDSKADPALYVTSTGNWYVKLSASGYGLVTLNFGGTGYTAVDGDYDGDGKADPAVYEMATGNWSVKLSASGYAIATLTGFGSAGYTPIAADYDGDGKADPALYEQATGNWYVKLSDSEYGVVTLTGFGGSGMAMKVANFDGDGKADPAVYEQATGNWYVKLSGSGYATASLAGFGGAGYDAGAFDFDGDGKADPTIYEEATGNWYVKLSTSGYATASLLGFGGAGYSKDASDFDGDRKADPILFETATGMWMVKLSAGGYATATLASGYTP